MDRDTALRDLRQGDGEARRRAARTLGRWPDAQVVDALVGALSVADRGTRDAASDTLIEIGDADTARRLVPVLGSELPAARNAARVLLQRLAQAAPEILAGLARDPDPRMRIFAANILGDAGDHDGVTPLLGLLEDPEENVRDAAAAALGALGASEAVPGLERLAAGESSWIRFTAIDALRRIPSAESCRALQRLLASLPAEFHDPVAEALLDLQNGLGLGKELP